MAFVLQSGGRARGKRGARPEMNVTPLVDVVLVLLIIFMVVSPLLAKQFWLHVPKREESQEPAADNDDPPVVLAVTAAGTLKLGPDEVPDRALEEKLRRVFAAKREHTLFFNAAPDVPFGRAMEAMDLARGGGAATIAVMTEGEVH